MRILWKQTITALVILGTTPQMAEACISVYMDSNVNAAQSEVEAWASIDDCEMGYPYYEHQYMAKVRITSPTQSYVQDVDQTSWIPMGGGSADAYDAISYVGDPGVYDVELEVWIYCSIVWELFWQYENVPVQAPVCDLGFVDGAAVGVLLQWPTQEPWERGVHMFCDGPNVLTFGYYGDSFGQFYAGFGATNDPCKVGMLAAPPSNLAAGAHSHPYFDTLAEYHAGAGCLGDQTYRSPSWIYSYNTVTNTNFSTLDMAWSNSANVNKPYYMRIPESDEVKRYWPPAPGPAVQVVYP